METLLQAEERAAGAVFAVSDGCTLPEMFSGFLDEYRAARDSAAIFDTSWHATYALTGPDRVRFLNAIVSNNIQSLADGRGALALLLSPQGRILTELEAFRLPDRLLVRTHASVRDRTRESLEKYIIMDDVELSDATDSVGSFAVEGPQAASILREHCGIDAGDLPALYILDTRVEGASCQIILKSHFGLPGAEFLAAPDSLGSLWTTLLAAIRARGGAPIGMQALNSLRLEAGVPWFPADFNDNVIPHEAALEDSHISYSRGCYTGQEIVERVRSRGQVNRRRVRLQFSTPMPPEFGARLFSAGKEVGLVTSAAFSPQARAAVGMGYLRREHIAPGSVVEFDGGTATVI